MHFATVGSFFCSSAVLGFNMQKFARFELRVSHSTVSK